MSPSERLASRLSVCRDVLEQVLLDLPLLPPRMDRAPLVSLLERALGLLAQLAEGSIADPEHLDLASAASAAAVGCAAVLRVAGSRDVVRPLLQRLRSVERALAAYRSDAVDELVARRAWPESSRPETPFRASLGAPALHRLERGPLAPRARVEAPEPTDGSADGEPAPPRPAKDDAPSAVLLVEQLRRLAHDCFAELGALGNLREPSDEVPWCPELGRFEQRLLADLDAVVALGRPVFFDGAPTLRLDVLGELLAFASDELVPDPRRAFARAFVLGCVEGEDAVRAAVLGLRQSDPQTHGAQRSALSLGSSPAIAPAMESLALGDDPGLAALALGVLRARREVPIALATLLSAHPDARVRRASALSLGAAKERGPAVALLVSTLDIDAEDAALAASAESLVRLGSKEGLLFARRRLVEARGSMDREASLDLARILALAGGPSDGATLFELFDASPSEARIALIGSHGHPGSVDRLAQALLEAGSSSPGGGAVVSPQARREALGLRRALARALHRITGVEVEPTAAGAEGFVAWWTEHEDRFGSSADRTLSASKAPRRYRFGRPYAPHESLDELAASGPAGAREALALEVAAASSGHVRIEVTGWVARQIGEIAAARDVLAGASFRPGDWTESWLG